MPTNRFSMKPLKVKLLAGEQKATELYLPGNLRLRWDDLRSIIKGRKCSTEKAAVGHFQPIL